MHETDDQKRWLDLLDDLGLPPESHAAPPPVPKAAPVAEVVAPAPAEAAPVAEAAPEEAPAPRTRRKKAAAPEGDAEKEPASRPRRKRRVVKAEEVAEEAPALAEEPTLVAVEHVVIELPAEVFTPVVVVTPTLSEEVEPEADEPSDSEATAEPNGEDPAKRRRRRRRRRKPSDGVEGSSVQPAVAGRALAEEALEDSEEDEESAPVFATEIVFDEEDEEPSETPPVREEDMEFEDLSNLDMPSWAELVGSLYRPADR